MDLPIRIALKYLFSQKKKRVVNIISIISTIGVTIGTVALVVGMSVYNGLDLLVGQLISSTDPDLKIVQVDGRSFIDSLSCNIEEIEGISSIHSTIKEQALLQTKSGQLISYVIGIDSAYLYRINRDKINFKGTPDLKDPPFYSIVLGRGVAYQLGTYSSSLEPISIYFPKRNKKNLTGLNSSLNKKLTYCSATFNVQQDADNTTSFISSELADQLFQMDGKITSLDLFISSNIDDIKDKIQDIVGDSYKVLDKQEQHPSINKLLKSEKLIGYFILIFILAIASFNIVATLTMLILEKKEDIKLLRSLGLSYQKIKRIFIYNGIMISAIGVNIGTVVGLTICYIQIHFKLITIGNSSFAMDSYPVMVKSSDIIAIYITVLIIGALAAYIPTKVIKKED